MSEIFLQQSGISLSVVERKKNLVIYCDELIDTNYMPDLEEQQNIK